MATNTVRFHRVLRAPRPNGFTGMVHHIDARVGGTFRMSFTNFTIGQTILWTIWRWRSKFRSTSVLITTWEEP